MAEDELNELAEQADPRLLPRRGVPALEDADQPVPVPGAGRGGAPVGVRQEQVECRRRKLQQRLVRAHRVVFDIDRAQDAAVEVPEFRRPQQVKAVGDRIEAIAAAGVAPAPPSCLRVTVEADADPDPQALERAQHRAVEQGAVGLEGHPYLGGHAGAKQADQAVQPLRSCEQRLAAMQDDVNALEAVPADVLGDALDGFAGHEGTHPPGKPPPALIRHFIHVAVRARQITATVDFQNKLPEGKGTVPRGPDFRHIEVEYWPRGWMPGLLRRRHSNQAAKSSGSAWISWPARHACTSNRSGRREASAGCGDTAGNR